MLNSRFRCKLLSQARSVAIRALSSAKAQKPLILLDVDGVINFIGRPGGNALANNKAANIATSDKRVFRIQWSTILIDEINRWSTVAEIRWLTTWDEDARKCLAPVLGINEFPLARDPLRKLEKWDAAYENVVDSPDRKLIWIDDDMSYFKMMARRSSNMKHVLERGNVAFVEPDIQTGLTKDDIDMINNLLHEEDWDNLKV
jgi:hypothetical protein